MMHVLGSCSAPEALRWDRTLCGATCSLAQACRSPSSAPTLRQRYDAQLLFPARVPLIFPVCVPLFHFERLILGLPLFYVLRRRSSPSVLRPPASPRTLMLELVAWICWQRSPCPTSVIRL